MSLLSCAKTPCISCPYRKDVPSGVWDKSEYAKLPEYDAPTGEQLLTGAASLFFCHTTNDRLCAGWVATHNRTSIAMRLQHKRIEPSMFDYESPVELFKTGTAAAKHGTKAINRPSARAKQMVERILRKRDGRA